MLEKVRAMDAAEKEKYLNEVQEAARYNEAEYGSTVRCILHTLHKYLGLYDDERVKGAIKAAAAFPGGIAGNTEGVRGHGRPVSWSRNMGLAVSSQVV